MIRKYFATILSLSLTASLVHAKSIHTIHVSKILSRVQEASFVKVAKDSPLELIQRAEAQYKECTGHVANLSLSLELSEEVESQIQVAAVLLNEELEKAYEILEPVLEKGGSVVVEGEKESAVVMDFVLLYSASATYFELASQGLASPQVLVFGELLKLCETTAKNKITKRDASRMLPSKAAEFLRTLKDMSTKIKELSEKAKPILEKSYPVIESKPIQTTTA